MSSTDEKTAVRFCELFYPNLERNPADLGPLYDPQAQKVFCSQNTEVFTGSTEIQNHLDHFPASKTVVLLSKCVSFGEHIHIFVNGWIVRGTDNPMSFCHSFILERMKENRKALLIIREIQLINPPESNVVPRTLSKGPTGFIMEQDPKTTTAISQPPSIPPQSLRPIPPQQSTPPQVTPPPQPSRYADPLQPQYQAPDSYVAQPPYNASRYDQVPALASHRREDAYASAAPTQDYLPEPPQSYYAQQAAGRDYRVPAEEPNLTPPGLTPQPDTGKPEPRRQQRKKNQRQTHPPGIGGGDDSWGDVLPQQSTYQTASVPSTQPSTAVPPDEYQGSQDHYYHTDNSYRTRRQDRQGGKGRQGSNTYQTHSSQPYESNTYSSQRQRRPQQEAPAWTTYSSATYSTHTSRSEYHTPPHEDSSVQYSSSYSTYKSPETQSNSYSTGKSVFA